MSVRNPHWWHINGVPINMVKMWLMLTRWFFHFLPGPLHLICVTWSRVSAHGHYNHVNGCQFGLKDQTSGANLQIEGHVDVQSQSQMDPEEMGASGSSPLHSPSWSSARRLLPSHPNSKYCLEIHVTLTEETGVVPPPSHAWTVPLVEDMLHHARSGLTKAMVMGPGRAVLFYGRHSLWEGLSPGESSDTTFMLTGMGTLVGKPAYLATDPLTIQEGWQEIA